MSMKYFVWGIRNYISIAVTTISRRYRRLTHRCNISPCFRQLFFGEAKAANRTEYRQPFLVLIAIEMYTSRIFFEVYFYLRSLGIDRERRKRQEKHR